MRAKWRVGPSPRNGRTDDYRPLEDVELEAFGLADRLSVMVVHGDADSLYWHELICRVDVENGKAMDPSFPYVMIERQLGAG